MRRFAKINPREISEFTVASVPESNYCRIRLSDYEGVHAGLRLCCSHAPRAGFHATRPKSECMKLIRCHYNEFICYCSFSPLGQVHAHPIDSIKSQVSMKDKNAETKKKGHGG